MTDTSTKLEQKIKIKFKDKKLLAKCLVHKSHNNIDNNEKLEFLGDRVLGLVFAKTLLKVRESKLSSKKWMINEGLTYSLCSDFF